MKRNLSPSSTTNGAEKTDIQLNQEGGYMFDLQRMIATVKKETKWRDIFKIVEEAQRRLKKGEVPAAKFTTSLSERPTYIKHWETSLPDGNQIRILSENGLEIINCRWKNYRRNNPLKNEKEKVKKD
jgi:hypothetical protein